MSKSGCVGDFVDFRVGVLHLASRLGLLSRGVSECVYNFALVGGLTLLYKPSYIKNIFYVMFQEFCKHFAIKPVRCILKLAC